MSRPRGTRGRRRNADGVLRSRWVSGRIRRLVSLNDSTLNRPERPSRCAETNRLASGARTRLGAGQASLGVLGGCRRRQPGGDERGCALGAVGRDRRPVRREIDEPQGICGELLRRGRGVVEPFAGAVASEPGATVICCSRWPSSGEVDEWSPQRGGLEPARCRSSRDSITSGWSPSVRTTSCTAERGR
jgi:hypothetical protein